MTEASTKHSIGVSCMRRHFDLEEALRHLLLLAIIIALTPISALAAAKRPAAPKMTGPAATYVGGKPMISFSGAPHSAFRVKVTSDPPGAKPVWESPYLSSTGYSAPCPVALQDGVYYASAQIMNENGWSSWSKDVIVFSVERKREKVDVRHMDEPGLLKTAAAAPNDMFGFMLPLAEEHSGKIFTFSSSYLGRTNSMLRIEDDGHGAPTDFLRRHCVEAIDLDKGVTVVVAVRVQAQQVFGRNPLSAVPIWEQGQVMIVDSRSANSEPVGASFRMMKDVNWRGKMAYIGQESMVGACVDNISWQEAHLGFQCNDFTVVRLTGKNQTAGDFSTTKWNLYVNEEPIPAVSAVGSMPQSVMDPKKTWMTADCVVIGSGYASAEGVWDYDWLAVNMGGDYAPGEWDSATNAGSRNWNGPYDSIGAIRKADETAFATLSRPAVVTKIEKNLAAEQTAFYVSDDTGGIRMNTEGPGIGVNSGNLMAALPGREVKWVRGVVPWLVNLARVSENIDSVVHRAYPQPEFYKPAVAMTSIASEAKPAELTLKELIGNGPVNDPSEIPTKYLGAYVAVKGRLVLQQCEDGASNWSYYIDDKTNPNAVDGRGGPELRGIRVLRIKDPSDPGSDVRVWANTNWRIDGIVTYERNGLGKYVLTLASPSFKMLL